MIKTVTSSSGLVEYIDKDGLVYAIEQAAPNHIEISSETVKNDPDKFKYVSIPAEIFGRMVVDTYGGYVPETNYDDLRHEAARAAMAACVKRKPVDTDSAVAIMIAVEAVIDMLKAKQEEAE